MIFSPIFQVCFILIPEIYVDKNQEEMNIVKNIVVGQFQVKALLTDEKY